MTSEENNNQIDQAQTDNVEEEKDDSTSIPVFIQTLADVGTIPVQITTMDTAQDIKQFLYETADTCYYTSFDIYLDGEKLNEYTELKQVPNVQPNCTFQMREAAYDERSSRLHVRRVREILGMNFLNPSVSPSVFSYYNLSDDLGEEPSSQEGEADADKKKNKGNKKSNAKKVAPITEMTTAKTTSSLKEYYPPPPPPPSSCLTSLTFSGYNPPQGSRRLQGDFYYLDVVTLENQTYHITAWDWGFFLNSSTPTHFNPAPSTKHAPYYTLVELLGTLSPSFKANFKSLLASPIDRHPFELMPVLVPVHPWVGLVRGHTLDRNRSEDALVYASDNPDIRGTLRDWNEEFQSCKELPKNTIQERLQRDRAVVRINSEFVEVATRGAMAVINKSIPPINPMDQPRAHMFIYNNIFFSFALDSRDLYQGVGGDQIAHVAAKNDIAGVKLYNLVDIEGLHTVLTAVIDYRGYRVVAQSIIPGILTNEKVSQVVYGSIDQGKTIAADKDFHELMVRAGKMLHIGENPVSKGDKENKGDKEDNEDQGGKAEGEGEVVVLASAVDSKGIVGTDGRKYILDLIRPSPRDPNYPEPEHLMHILRPEAIAGYSEILRLKKLDENSRKVAEDGQKPKKTEGENAMDANKHEGENGKGDEAEGEKQTENKSEEVFLNLNPNLFCASARVALSDDEKQKAETSLKDIGHFLTDMVIPAFEQDLRHFLVTPMDGVALSNGMHARGINMRYLGRIAQQIASPVTLNLFVTEMVTRAAKHIFSTHLRTTESYHISHSISHFLNCFLGAKTGGGISAIQPPKAIRPKMKHGSAKDQNQPSVSPFKLTRSSLWSEITTLVKQKFQYDLPSDVALDALVTLRSFCLKVGVQVAARDYDFAGKADPFTPADLLDLYPIVKHINPKSLDGQDLLEAGKAMIQQGRLNMANQLLGEALTIVQQVHGPLHPDSATCESNLAMVLYNAGDLPGAINHQARATVINERVLGLDHQDTTHAYGNLALFCHQHDKTKEALAFMYRALYLGNLASGPLHPEKGTTFTNIGVMLQDLDRTDLAIAYFKEALVVNEAIYGPNNLLTAGVLHHLAMAHDRKQDFKEAMLQQKRHYALLSRLFGDQDIRTKDSLQWLNQFTASAVAKQKELVQLTAMLPKSVSKKPEPIINQRLQPAPPTAKSTTSSMGNLPLSEVLRYINSDSARGKRGIQKLATAKSAAQPEQDDKMEEEEDVGKKSNGAEKTKANGEGKRRPKKKGK